MIRNAVLRHLNFQTTILENNILATDKAAKQGLGGDYPFAGDKIALSIVGHDQE